MTFNTLPSTKALLASLFAVYALTACKPAEQAETTAAPSDEVAETTSVAENLNTAEAIDAAAKQIDDAGFMQHVRTLASDEFEGRAPSTPGGEKTVAYLETQFAELGLEPAFELDGKPSYRQAVDLMELTVTNSPSLTLTHAEGSEQTLEYQQDSVVFSSRTGEKQQLNSSSLVFVGYGIVAPEYGWNDYAGLDMTGKTAVILVNDPGYRTPEGELFKGRAMTYYGRWTYKYEEAARQGAAGAIIVHEDGAAGYPWEVVSGSWSGAQYYLLTEDGNQNNLAVEAWITQPAAESLFTSNGLDFQAMVSAATQPGFKPVALKSTASTTLELTSRQSKSYNVGAVVPGRSNADEAFIYTAHWDHLGKKSVPEGEDAIFNGAQDNATGTSALLELAQAFKALPQAPERSVIFVAVTAEESGLLGSKHYAENPAFPMNKTVAGINVDGMSTIGATDDIVVVGYGNSEMDDYLRRVSATQNRTVVPEPTPEKGYFYRSDHFNLAKKGVPMLYAEAGLQIRGKPADYGQQESDRYLAERYHKAGDEIHPEWDNGGILQDLYAHFVIGVQISDGDARPQWSEGNEFKAIREASLSAN